MDPASTTNPSDDIFRAVLYPHRSLGPKGFLILMSAIGGISFVIGLVFLSMGAWPVFGFFGLDVALIYFAFKLNYRDAHRYDLIELNHQRLALTRVDAAGAESRFEFNPYCVRVLLSEQSNGRTALSLTSHGKSFGVAEFLNDDERRDFAKALQNAIQVARAGPDFQTA